MFVQTLKERQALHINLDSSRCKQFERSTKHSEGLKRTSLAMNGNGNNGELFIFRKKKLSVQFKRFMTALNIVKQKPNTLFLQIVVFT